jgi:hypothetical protein
MILTIGRRRHLDGAFPSRFDFVLRVPSARKRRRILGPKDS